MKFGLRLKYRMLFFLFLAQCTVGLWGNDESVKKQGGDKKSPNIILVMSDDQGWGDVSYHGNKMALTPHLDQMSEDGIRLKQFYAASPVCSPTRASVLTGRHPYRSGISWAGHVPLPAGEVTIAEALGAIGYRTGHFGKWHLGVISRTIPQGYIPGEHKPEWYSPPWEHGFNVCFSTQAMMPTYNPYYYPLGEPGNSSYEPIMNREVNFGERNGVRWRDYYWTEDGRIVDENLAGDDSTIIMNKVIKFIDNSLDEEKPFLAVVWFHTPHSPIVSGDHDRKPFESLNLPIEAQHWFGALRAMDRQIGRLRGHLRKRNVEENTLIWFTSDNGPSSIHDYNSSGPFQGKKGSLWEGGVRVPAIIEWPNQFISEDIEMPSSTSDIFPTILDILGELDKFNLNFDGGSILPVLQNRSKDQFRLIPFISPIKSSTSHWPERGLTQRAMASNRYKVISFDNGENYMLFDILTDPSESSDISEKYPDVKENLISKLENWCENVISDYQAIKIKNDRLLER